MSSRRTEPLAEAMAEGEATPVRSASSDGVNSQVDELVAAVLRLAERTGPDDRARLDVVRQLGEALEHLEPADAVRAVIALERLADPTVSASLLAGAIPRLPAAERVSVLLAMTSDDDGRPSQSVAWFTWEALLAALVDCANDHASLVIDVDHDTPRTAGWVRLLELVEPIGMRTTYVGGFRKMLGHAAEHAPRSLEGHDRLIAARLLVDRTAFGARNWQDFVDGIRAAQALDRHLLAPASVLQNVAWPCLAYDPPPPSVPPVMHGLHVAFDVMAAAKRPLLVGLQHRRMRFILDALPEEQRVVVPDLAARIDREDRHAIAKMLEPERAAGRRRWRHR